jgi:acetyl-CoA carboxylase/biotin carboxylase 1
VERWFCDGKEYAEALDNLRKSNKDNYHHVLNICRAHSQLRSTAGIVTTLIDCIVESVRIDRDSIEYSQSPKRMSIVAGAASLGTTVPCLSDIGCMGGSDIYASIALKARRLILQESLPSISQRIVRCKETVHFMISANEEMSPGSFPELDHFIRENVPLSDIFYPLLHSFNDDSNRQLCLIELKMRQMYQTYTLHGLEQIPKSRILRFSFINRSEEAVINNLLPVRSMTELTLAISRPASMQKLGDLSSDSEADRTSLSWWHSSEHQVPHLMTRHVTCKLIDTLSDIGSESSFESILQSFDLQINSSTSTHLTNMLYVIVTKELVEMALGEHDAIVLKLQSILSPHHSKLRQAGIRRVSFILNHCKDEAVDNFPLPALFTFRENYDFREDSLIRNIEPSYAYHLELSRLATNFSVRRIVTRQTSTGNVHLYKATPKQEAIDRYTTAHRSPRIFVRSLSFVSEFSSTSFETILLDSLNALDLSVHDVGSYSDNHLFISFIAGYDRRVLDPVMVEQTVVSVLKRHGDRISAMGLTEVETKAACCLNEDSPPIIIRMVASNPTGYVQVMDTYVEAAGNSGVPVFKLIGGTKSSIACSGDSSWEGMEVTSPYPLVRPFDTQRKAALSASDSLYCYDLPALFEAAVEQQWTNATSKNGVEHIAARPLMVIQTTELVVAKKNGKSGSWSMDDYLSKDLELVPIQRRAGSNDVGMVSWLITLKTVEYPNVRLAF